MSSLSPTEIQGTLTSGQESRVLSNETDLPSIPLKGGNAGCSACTHGLRGGARKSYRKKSSRKNKRGGRKTRRNRRKL